MPRDERSPVRYRPGSEANDDDHYHEAVLRSLAARTGERWRNSETNGRQ
jgi:hypothetical protein